MKLHLPTLANWSCRSCAGCCRQHAIVVTPAERERIESQNWSPSELGVRKLFDDYRGQKRLAHQHDGACVFLNEAGLCRIHARFGEPAKPLACRIYPYAFHPIDNGVAVSLRFSCPTVVRNQGESVESQRDELQLLTELAIPAGSERSAPPEISRGQRLDWPDTLRIATALGGMVVDDAVPLELRILRGLFLAKLIGQAKLDSVRGEQLDGLLSLLGTAAPQETPGDLASVSEPSKIARVQFRLLAAQYARHDTFADTSRGIGYRLRMMLGGLKMALGSGSTPRVRDDLKPARFEDLDAVSIAITPAVDELFSRYFSVKLQGMHFAGAAFYGANVVEGFANMLLMLPMVLYLAKWHAAGEGRALATDDDVRLAMTIADHPQGYSPALGQANFRSRVRYLIENDQIGPLLRWSVHATPKSENA